MVDLPDISQIEGFDWDKGNVEKNWKSHRVSFYECEEIFLRAPIVVPDIKHSAAEKRYFALGRTVRDRSLTVVFTIRQNKIRVVSARAMSKKEKIFYEDSQKNS